ncbi:MAG: hypothetical protein NDJ92_15890 [Thermoanaerobaculia bacterium]|nr:hypothetical protein [Thermoanaerobaculia bacterium]
MNSRLEYLYRNASNYKKWGAVVFSGTADAALSRRLVNALESQEFFIANQVRVPELFFDDGLKPEEDLCWHEFVALETVDEEPTDQFSRTVVSFVEECEAASRAGWQVVDLMRREPNR